MARKSHIYIDMSYLQPDDEVRPSTHNAAFDILIRHYAILPPVVQEEADVLIHHRDLDGVQIREWARLFKIAYENGDPLPRRRFGSTVSVDTSLAKGDEDMSAMATAYLAVLQAGRHGVTSIEARRNGEVGGGISGALTKLHQHGVIACLKRTR